MSDSIGGGDFNFREGNLKLMDSPKVPIEDRVRQRADSIHSSASSKSEILASLAEKAKATQEATIKLTFKDLNYWVTIPKTK